MCIFSIMYFLNSSSFSLMSLSSFLNTFEKMTRSLRTIFTSSLSIFIEARLSLWRPRVFSSLYSSVFIRYWSYGSATPLFSFNFFTFMLMLSCDAIINDSRSRCNLDIHKNMQRNQAFFLLKQLFFVLFKGRLWSRN